MGCPNWTITDKAIQKLKGRFLENNLGTFLRT
jgi:hypothetical protein